MKKHLYDASWTQAESGRLQPTIDTVLLKTASRCNLDCTYCYVYHLGDDAWRAQPKRMSIEVIQAIVEQLGLLAESQGKPFNVCLHGGEPLLLGRERLELLLRGVKSVLTSSCSLNVQTNGLLLSEGMIDLLVEHDVGVSISYDGPKEIHDATRVDRRGRGSHDAVRSAIERLKAHEAGKQLWSGLLAVVNPASDAAEVYDHLKATGAPGIDFLYRDGNRTKLPAGKASVSSTEYGRWMRDLFQAYVADPSPPRIRILDDLMRLILGAEGHKEGLGLTDYGILVIDTDGTVTKNDTLKVAYNSADRFNKPVSILDRNLVTFTRNIEMDEYRKLQRPTSPECLACPDLSVCGGGMPAHRWSDESGYNNPSVFCEDQKLLIAELRTELRASKAAA